MKEKISSFNSFLLILLLFVFFNDVNVVIAETPFNSKKESQHAGYSQYNYPPIIHEFQQYLDKKYHSSKHEIILQKLSETNFTVQHLEIKRFCQQIKNRFSCDWTEYYHLLHYLRESHEQLDDIGVYDSVKKSIKDIQQSPQLPPWNQRECEIIAEPTSKQFYEYVKSSRPFVVRGLAKDWPAIKKWSFAYLDSLLHATEIYVGASPSGDFVGPEPSSLWNFDEDEEDVIFAKPVHFFLPFSQLVETYRRKIMSRRKNRFHLNLFEDEEDDEENDDELLSTKGNENDIDDENDPKSLNFVPFRNVTLYMEYYPIGRLHTSLKSDLGDVHWLSFLSLLMQLVWMGGGDDPKTSPLHYDKFENIMIMIAGSKEFKLFSPSQSAYVYGDELSRGGKLTTTPIYFPGTNKIIDLNFERLHSNIDPVRSHSTYTMVDLDHLNLTKFPLMKNADMITCTIEKGDLLYIPSHWWHEVTSFDDHEGKSIGISHFFEPFYHLPSERSRSPYHTLSEYYSPIREDGLNNIEFCDNNDNDGLICFRNADDEDGDEDEQHEDEDEVEEISSRRKRKKRPKQRTTGMKGDQQKSYSKTIRRKNKNSKRRSRREL